MRLRLLSLCLLTSLTLQAQTPLHLSLADAIQSSLRSGTTAQLARTNAERARIAESEALENLLPQADARLSAYNQSINLQTFGFSIPGQPAVVGPFDVVDANLRAAVQLFNVAAVRRLQAVRAGVKASRWETEQADNDVAQAVARLYVLVQRAGAQIASREADVTFFTRLAQLAKDEFDAGTGTRLEIAQANAQVSRAKQALLVAQNDRQNAIFALLNAMGADQSSQVIITDPIPEYGPAPAPDEALTEARSNRPELKAAHEREREAELNLSAARSRRIPSLGADFEGDYNGNSTSELHWTRRIAGNVAIPLFRADINTFIARAKAQLLDVQIQREQRERDVEQDVRRSILNVESTEARVQVANETVKVAEEALTIARDRREAGYGSPVEVDRAQDVYRQAHEDLIQAQAEAAVAHVDLLHATGDIHQMVGTK